jgi:N-acetylglucosaminyl-diphospho-decaprenol L-rhamnosyltransferase
MNNLLSNLTVNILTYRTNQEILENCIMSIDKTVRINIIENSHELKNQEHYKKLNPNLEVYLTGKNLGYGRGHNFGLQKVKTQYVLILNPDLVCKENYFKNIQVYFTKDIDFSIIGSQYEKHKMDKPAYGLFESKIYNDNLPTNEINLQKVDWVVGCSMLFNLEKFNNRNLFDENFFLFFEETDLCRRTKLLGQNIYSSKSLLIDHFGEKGSFASDENNKLSYIKLRNWHLMWSSFYYYKKNNNYMFALKKSLGTLVRSFFKAIFYSIIFNKNEKTKYYYRFLGLYNSMIGRKSWYRP